MVGWFGERGKGVEGRVREVPWRGEGRRGGGGPGREGKGRGKRGEKGKGGMGRREKEGKES